MVIRFASTLHRSLPVSPPPQEGHRLLLPNKKPPETALKFKLMIEDQAAINPCRRKDSNIGF